VAGGARPELRASDAEREHAVAVLKEHAAVGRLDLDELDDRIGRAYGARTRRELDALLSDLPEPRPATRAMRRTRGRPKAPGVLDFKEVFDYQRPPADVRAQALAHIAPALYGHGFHLDIETEDVLEFVRPPARGAGSVLLAIVTFPFGLLFLLRGEAWRIRVQFVEREPGHTRMTVFGLAPLFVRRAIARLNP
jgi:hypothetical protein